MSTDSTSPVAVQPLAKEPLSAEQPKVEYFRALSYFFEHPDWVNTLLMGSICMLIPMLNAIVLAGYRYEIVEMRLRFPDQRFPKFDFARFSQYITRGIWPFLIDLVVQMVLVVPILVVIYGSMIGLGIAVAASPRVGIIAIAIVVPLLILFLMAVSLILSVALIPLYLRAGLSQDFGQALKMPWIKDFIAKMWLDSLLFNLFLMVAGGILGILGELACGIGLLPVMFLLGGPVVAHAHYQLYRLYLARGGEPIPLKPISVSPSETPPATGTVVPVQAPG